MAPIRAAWTSSRLISHSVSFFCFVLMVVALLEAVEDSVLEAGLPEVLLEDVVHQGLVTTRLDDLAFITDARLIHIADFDVLGQLLNQLGPLLLRHVVFQTVIHLEILLAFIDDLALALLVILSSLAARDAFPLRPLQAVGYHGILPQSS